MVMFQSRNRGSFLFKPIGKVGSMTKRSLFQSRNRGSFLFKLQAETPQNRLPFEVSIS